MRVVLPLILGILALAEPALGAGFDVTVQGTRGIARGGATTASLTDPSSVENNPGVSNRLTGTRLYLSLSPMYAPIAYRRAPLYDWSRSVGDNPPPAVHYDQIENQVPLFPLSGAYLGMTTDLGLERWTFGLAVHGPTALGHTRFPKDGPQRYQMVERDVMMAVYSLSAAWGDRDRYGLGLTLQWLDIPSTTMALVVDANNQSSTVYPDHSPYDVLVTMDTSDRVNFTATAGGWFMPWPWLEVAVAGRILPVRFDTRGSLTLEGTGDMLAGKTLKTFRREGEGLVPDDSAGIELGYAPTARLGLRYLPHEGLDLELDLVWEGWSVMDGYDVSLPDVARVEELGLDVDLHDIVMDRSWQDTWSARLGGSWRWLPWLELSAGAFYETAAVPLDYTFLDFLSFERLGLAAGFGLRLGDVTLDLGYVHVFNEPRAVSEMDGKMYQVRPGATCVDPPYDGPGCDPHYRGQPGPAVNAGTYLSGYDVLSLAVGVAWGAAEEAVEDNARDEEATAGRE